MRFLKLRSGLLLLGVLSGVVLNVTIAPQIMSPRPPVHNGADIAENWEWRSMANGMHGWWLYEHFPRSKAINVGFVSPPGMPDGLAVGMDFSKWVDQDLGLDVDGTLPPLDLTSISLSDELSEFRMLYSRIDCRTGQEMVDDDTCYYFVAWDPTTITNTPTFVGVMTNATPREEEFGIVEQGLLKRLTGDLWSGLKPIDQVLP